MRTFVAFLLLGSLAFAQNPSPTPRQPSSIITQTGEGVISAAPDEGYIIGGVENVAPAASDALTANATTMTQVLSALKTAGVPPTQITTVNFSIEDHYNRSGSTAVKDGYVVENKVRVCVKDLTKFGSVIDAMVGAGANRIDSLRLGNSKESALTDQARTSAVADATRRANLIAGALGYTLGDVTTTNEVVTSRGRGDYGYSAYMRVASAADSSPTPISGGSQDFRITVNVTWTLVKKVSGDDAHIPSGEDTKSPKK